MAKIRLTYQKPDDTETHDIPGEDEESHILDPTPTISLLHETAADKSPELLTPSFLSTRRSSGLSVSSLTNFSTVQPRKFSFPAALPSSLLGLDSTGMGLLAKRRFSNVSDAVTRKLSHTIGWRSGHIQSREIVAVGKSLCSQYIRSKLKRSGYLSRKCGLQRLRSAVSLPSGTVFREVYPELLAIGVELERLHPKVYINVSRQASSAPGGRLTSEKEAGAILTAVSRELLKNELTWGKVVSLYAVAGGLAVDCVRQGHYDYLSSIVEAMEEILEEELTHWIQYKGGWMSKCKHSFQNFSVCQTLDELDFERGIWSAAQQNDITKVKQWVSNKDVNAVDKYGYTALHYASRNGHFEICKLLISHGADVNALTESGKVSPLHRCVSIGHTDIFQLLIESGASVDIKDGDGKTILHRAVEGGHSNLVEKILKINPSLVKEIDKKGYTPKQYLNNSKTLLDLFNKYSLEN